MKERILISTEKVDISRLLLTNGVYFSLVASMFPYNPSSENTIILYKFLSKYTLALWFFSSSHKERQDSRLTSPGALIV